MERQELIDFLRENLSINLSVERGYDFGNESIIIESTLNLNDNGENIILSQDCDSFSIDN